MYGGDSSEIQPELANNEGVQRVYSNYRAFAAITSSGKVVTWGCRKYGGDSESVAARLRSGVVVARHVLGRNHITSATYPGTNSAGAKPASCTLPRNAPSNCSAVNVPGNLLYRLPVRLILRMLLHQEPVRPHQRAHPSRQGESPGNGLQRPHRRLK